MPKRATNPFRIASGRAKTYGGTCCGNALWISEQQKVDFMQLLKLVRYLGNLIVGRVNLLEQLQSTSTSHDVAGKNN